MSITSYSQVRFGNVTTVTVVSDLADVAIWYHWYLDGVWVGRSASPERSFWLEPDDQARVEVLDTADPDFDWAGAAPEEHPARRLVWWTRVVDADCHHYRVEQKAGAGDWTAIGEIPQDDRSWTYSLVTPRLTDLTDYQWRVVPVDAAGNDGTPASISSETVVRRPDAPDFAIAFDEGTTKVTFSAA